MDNKFIRANLLRFNSSYVHDMFTICNFLIINWYDWRKVLANEKGARCILLVIAGVLIFTKNSIRTSFELFSDWNLSKKVGSRLDRVSINIKDVNKLAFKIFPKIFNTKLHWLIN